MPSSATSARPGFSVMLGWHGGPQLGLDLVYGGLGLYLASAGIRTVAVAVGARPSEGAG